MRDLIAEFRSGALADWPILAGLFFVWAVLLGLLAYHGLNGIRFMPYLANLAVYVSALLFFLAYRIGLLLLRLRPDRPISCLAASFVSGGLAHRLMRGAPMLLSMVSMIPP